MTPFPYHGHPGGAALDETIYANLDAVTSVWEGGSPPGTDTTNIYVYVDSESDTDYVRLRNPTNHIVTSGTRSLRFDMQTPSGTPLSSQTVELKVRCEWVDVFGAANPDSGDPNITINLYENGSQVTGGGGSAQQLTTSPAEYSHFLSSAAISNVNNWADVEVDMDFECSGIDLDEEVSIYVYRVRIIFSP